MFRIYKILNSFSNVISIVDLLAEALLLPKQCWRAVQSKIISMNFVEQCDNGKKEP